MHTFRDRLASGAALDLWIQRRLIGIVNTRKLRKKSGSRFLIEAFHVSLFTYCQRSIYVDLNEPANIGPQFVTYGSIRRNCRHDRDYAILRQQFGNESDAANIFITVLFREAQVLREMAPNRISVQQFDFVSHGQKPLVDCMTDGGLARRTQPGKPER